jgi:hypothetical protein
VRLIPRRDPKREPLIRPEDILLSKRITWRTDDPFTIFECRDFLPPHAYHALAGSFPTQLLEERLGRHASRQERLALGDPALDAFLGKHSAWRDLVDALMSRTFVRDAFAVVGSEIRAAFRRREGLGTLSRQQAVALGLPRLQSLNFDFSLSVSGYRLTPHTDSPKKLLALLLYFPEATADEGPGAGTRFWRRRGETNELRDEWQLKGQLPRLIRASDRVDVVDDAMGAFEVAYRRFHVAEYRTNAMSGFVKTNESWHDVDLRDFPEGSRRRVMLYNINLR